MWKSRLCRLETKGLAVRKFLDEPAMRGALPIYFGDDISDEPAFAAAREGIPSIGGQTARDAGQVFPARAGRSDRGAFQGGRNDPVSGWARFRVRRCPGPPQGTFPD